MLGLGNIAKIYTTTKNSIEYLTKRFLSLFLVISNIRNKTAMKSSGIAVIFVVRDRPKNEALRKIYLNLLDLRYIEKRITAVAVSTVSRQSCFMVRLSPSKKGSVNKKRQLENASSGGASNDRSRIRNKSIENIIIAIP